MEPFHSSLADLLRAFAALKPRGEDRAAIARLLGFEEPAMASAPSLPMPKSRRLRKPLFRFPQKAQEKPTPDPVDTAAEPAPREMQVDAVLTPARIDVKAPEWLDSVDMLPAPPDSAPPAEEAPPLLVPIRSRAMLSGALSTLAPVGPIDMKAILESVISAKPVKRQLRQTIATLAGGVQVLVDRSDSMLPFEDDQEWLVNQIRATVGRERTGVLNVEPGGEFLAGKASRIHYRPYFEAHVAPSNTPVVAITDLGIGHVPLGHGATPGEWLTFAVELQRREIPFIAFVPYPPRRWPRLLRRAFPIVHFDVTSTIANVRRAVGRGLSPQGRRRPR